MQLVVRQVRRRAGSWQPGVAGSDGNDAAS